jgi:RNA polymerase sigma-70 factor (ECF subfamily)
MTNFQNSGTRDGDQSSGSHDEEHRRELGHVDLQPRHPAQTASAPQTPAGGSQVTLIGPDRETEQWVKQLRPGHPRRDQTVAKLHEVLLRVAFHELSRRRPQLTSISGPELDDLAHQAANDALMKVLASLDKFRGLSRFTTWAYKFVVFEVAAKVARHAWRRQPPSRHGLAFEPHADSVTPRPGERLEQQEQLQALSTAIGELTERRREVFIAVALNDVPIDVLAIRLGTNRNAVYKNLFDARRSLRARMAAAGHPVGDKNAA